MRKRNNDREKVWSYIGSARRIEIRCLSATKPSDPSMHQHTTQTSHPIPIPTGVVLVRCDAWRSAGAGSNALSSLGLATPVNLRELIKSYLQKRPSYCTIAAMRNGAPDFLPGLWVHSPLTVGIWRRLNNCWHGTGMGRCGARYRPHICEFTAL